MAELHTQWDEVQLTWRSGTGKMWSIKELKQNKTIPASAVLEACVAEVRTKGTVHLILLRDVHYRRWKKKLPLDPPPVVPQPEQVAALNAKLAELPALLKGRGCLNEWGWGIDDVMLLPQLRAFTVVKGAVFPAAVAAYMNIEGTQMVDYRAHAV